VKDVTSVAALLRHHCVIAALRRHCIKLLDHKRRFAAASNRPLKMGPVAGADFLTGDALQWRGTRLCDPLPGNFFNFQVCAWGTFFSILTTHVNMINGSTLFLQFWLIWFETWRNISREAHRLIHCEQRKNPSSCLTTVSHKEE
jgi:hypothetical protein